MKRISILLAGAVGIAVLSGCYTQFAVVERPRPSPKVPCPDSLKDSCGQVVERDTVYIDDDERKICYWTRDWRGEPVLRCYRTYYSDSWVSYHSDPWWYSRYRDPYWGYGQCPSYYYYDPYTGYCRYYRDFDRYYYPIGGGSGGSAGGGSTAEKPDKFYRGRSRAGGTSSQEQTTPASRTRTGPTPYRAPAGTSTSSGSKARSSGQSSAPAVQPTRVRTRGSSERDATRKSSPADSEKQKQSSVRESSVREVQPKEPAANEMNERRESIQERKRKRARQ
ncbi:MAG: hypothetical protein GF331_19650 [Chitinivibrionales bacterium]|nr:hypothetical protein [Chitinivibrionales bacterium]